MSHKYYKVDKSGKVTTSRRTCPRCEKGTFMAEHYNRFACGRCGYTEFKRKGGKKKSSKKKKK